MARSDRVDFDCYAHYNVHNDMYHSAKKEKEKETMTFDQIKKAVENLSKSELDQLVLYFGMHGSRKHCSPETYLYRVTENGWSELESADGRSWALDLRDVAADHLTSVL